MRSAMRILLVGFLLALAVAGWLVWEVVRPYRGYAEAEQFVLLERGSSSRTIAEELQRNGVISSSRLFYFYLALSGKGSKLKAGEYRFSEASSMVQVAGKLYRGEVFAHKVTVPEGLTFSEIRQVFLDRGFGTVADFDTAFLDVAPIRDLDPDARNLEGYLFPETYLLTRGATAGSILQQMAQNFRSRFDEAHQKRAAGMGMTVRQIVTLASLIEEETALDDERYLVSSVYHNRLKRGMMLECDPTVVFAAQLQGVWDGVIHRSDLERESPYNTYRFAGLPPGPIASPGAKSLEAALAPAATRFLFFVAGEKGKHVFSEAWGQHRAAVQNYHKLRREAAEQR